MGWDYFEFAQKRIEIRLQNNDISTESPTCKPPVPNCIFDCRTTNPAICCCLRDAECTLRGLEGSLLYLDLLLLVRHCKTDIILLSSRSLNV